MGITRFNTTSTVVVTLLIFISGCGSDDTGETAAAAFPQTATRFDSYPAAQLDGIVSIEQNADGYCPRLEAGDAGSYLLVLPPDSEVTTDGIAIGEVQITAGKVTLGGGVMASAFDAAGCDSASPAWLVAP